MSNYTKVTNFTAKDSLPSGNPGKVVRGSEIDTEFSNIQTAVNSKADTASPTFTGTVVIPTATISGGTITGITDLAIADGGTGASTAQAARNNLLPSQTSNAGKYLKTDGTDASWDQLDISTADITGTLPVANGGTGATSASAARTALGLAIGTDVQAYDSELAALASTTSAADKLPYFTGAGTATTADFTSFGRSLVDDADASAARTTLGLGSIATQAANNVNITGGSVTGITDLAVADGGTGASTASGARTNLGLVIGTDVQAYDAQLADIAGLTPTDNNFIVGNGTNFVTESGATARTSLGLGSIATQDASNVSITGGSVTGITDLAVADGGTGASTASGARTNLGLVIGTDVQAYDAQLADIAGLTPTDNNFIVGNGTNFVTESGATARTSLGLGSIATQDASNVSITGGSVTGITDLAVADGGTGASTAANARVNLLPSYTGNGSKVLALNSGATDVEWTAVTTSAAGSTTQLQYNNAGSFAGASGLTTDGTNLTLNGQADLRFADSDSSNWVAFQAPTTISTNVTWTLPSADGTSGQVLSTDGSGTLSWTTASGGGGGGGGTSTTTTQFTATASQTTFTVSYTVGQISVYLNGALLAAADYTATNGTSVVLATGAAAGDILTVVAYSSVTTISQGDSSVAVTDSGSNGTISFKTDNSERMRVDSNGNLLIKTTTAEFNNTNRGLIEVNGTTSSAVVLKTADSGSGYIFHGGTDFLVTNVKNGAISFSTNNTERLRIPSDAAGIKFPATQSASSDANTLDDYEEGTWTPTIAGTSSATYTVQTGVYRKIGSLVYVFMRVAWSNAGGALYVNFAGLPFSVGSNFIPAYVGVFSPALAAGYSYATFYAGSSFSGTTIYSVQHKQDGTTADLSIASSGDVSLALVYHV